MRKMSSQLISLVVMITLISSMLALVISDQLVKLIFIGFPEEDMIILGLAAKEILSPFIVCLLSWIQISLYSKSITSPLNDLIQATIRISSGDFETQIQSRTKIKEMNTLQNNFNIMARELRNTETLKKDFVSNVSHEFKTPLAVIKGYADLLCDENLPVEERMEYAHVISEEASRLSNLTSNMLKMSKLNNQEILVSPKSFQLDEQIRRCVLLVMQKLNDKNMDIDIDLEPVTYTGDEDLLSQVWLNLLDNAIKYTNNGGKINVEMLQKPNHDIVVTISDNGIGMSEKTRCKIFEQFFQADKSHGKDGNGLGLSIVSRIIRLHGGSINVKSVENEGSEFKITLPVQTAGGKNN